MYFYTSLQPSVWISSNNSEQTQLEIKEDTKALCEKKFSKNEGVATYWQLVLFQLNFEPGCGSF